MKKRVSLLVCSLVLGGISVKSLGQVDPFWLRSWNAAQEHRPVELTSSSRIAPESEPGTPLLIRGAVVEPDGRTPARGVVVHAYHRDNRGFDFGLDDSELTTWRLQGWARTDAEGRFEFRTIRPAPDRMGREGAHVHLTLESGKFGRQWAHMIFFADDPRVAESQRKESAKAGEFGWVKDVRVENGAQIMAVRIRMKPQADF